jgi:adhesin transport system outer membrane protein
MKPTGRQILIALLFAGVSRLGIAREVSLTEALTLAEHYSPRLRAATLQDQAARKGIVAAESAYYPTITADGEDTWGFSGSGGAMGIPGLVGSTFRSGVTAGLVATDTLYDFGRTESSVKTARSGARIKSEEIGVDAYALDVDLLRTFYDCARYRSEYENWSALHDKTQYVAKEIARFVSTGQRSVVDKYLSQAQVDQAWTNSSYFLSRMNSTVKRLALLTGLAESGLTCPALPRLDESSPLAGSDVSPYVRRAEAEVDLARNRLSAARSDYLPKIVGVASVGTMQRALLIDKTDYSGGLGIVVPLFDGLGTIYRVGQAKTQLDSKAQELAAIRLDMDEADSKFDEAINASKARLKHLENELQLSEEGFHVAQDRYFRLQGTLVDLRDTIDNLGRIETDISDTQANFLEASGSKALLNGAMASMDRKQQEKL